MKTTMEHKSGRSPGSMAKNIPGHPSSKNVIRTTVSKPSCRADNFVYKSRGCGHIAGSPGTAMLD